MNNRPHHHHLPSFAHNTHLSPQANDQTNDSGVELRWHHPPCVGRDDVPILPTTTAIGSVDQNSLRKRRHIDQEHDRRPAPYPNRTPVGYAAPPPRAGTSRDAAINLMPPPAPTMIPRQLHRDEGANTERRRESDTRVPMWQPDGMVTACPVCQTRFTFWNRKHHCRKCGRVVCAACSPHRITIPRQYIVQVPAAEDLNWGDDQANSAARNPALGGGETVRVCNPCVPDPWEGPVSNNPPSRPAVIRGPTDIPVLNNLQRASNDDLRASRQRGERYHYNRPPPQLPNGRYRSLSSLPPSSANTSRPLAASQDNPRLGFRETNTGASRPIPTPPTGYHPDRPLPPSWFDSTHPSSSRPVPHRHTQSSSTATMDPRRMSGNFTQRMPNWGLPGDSFPTRPVPPPKAKRVVKEEDECPVCGIELPPDEQFRETHVQECISARFSTGATPPSATVLSNTTAADAVTTNTYPAVRTTGPTASSPTAASRPRATSYRPRGMAIYTATEKDCVNAEGEAQECVICFEEFQPGDELGRMECLCKFHRVCIRSWWERKGGGSCPTHQLQE